MKIFVVILSLSIVTSSFLLPVVASASDDFEFTANGVDYVFLGSMGPLGRLDADSACKKAGFKPIRTTEGCFGVQYILNCIQKMGAPLEKISNEIIKSQVWNRLPVLIGNADEAQIKGFWFGYDYGFTLQHNGQNLFIRFSTVEQVTPTSKKARFLVNEVAPNVQSIKLSVLCRR